MHQVQQPYITCNQVREPTSRAIKLGRRGVMLSHMFHKLRRSQIIVGTGCLHQSQVSSPILARMRSPQDLSRMVAFGSHSTKKRIGITGHGASDVCRMGQFVGDVTDTNGEPSMCARHTTATCLTADLRTNPQPHPLAHPLRSSYRANRPILATAPSG